MVQKLTGIINAATSIKQYTKKDGTKSESAMLHIVENTDNAYPQEVAVKVTGDLANYAGCVGWTVEVEYVVRVFSFTKDGVENLGNDIYARSIKKVEGDQKGGMSNE